MFIFPNSKWDPGDIILYSTLSLTSDAAGNQLARFSGFSGPANSCKRSKGLLYNSQSWVSLLLGGLYLRQTEEWKHFSLLFLQVPPLPTTTTTTGRNVLASYLQTP